MALTEEQQERIRKNRERALEIQRKRREEQEQKKKLEEELASKRSGGKRAGENGETFDGNKRIKLNEDKGNKGTEEEEEDDDLEAFEEGASDLVTKSEAKKMYCLPEGSLAVCAVVEKENPRHKSWSKMKLYYRSEVRRRSRKRHGGKEGLIAERRKREEERFQKDIEKTRNIFK